MPLWNEEHQRAGHKVPRVRETPPLPVQGSRGDVRVLPPGAPEDGRGNVEARNPGEEERGGRA